MPLGRYILNAAGEPVPAPSLLAWAAWFETADRRVALDRIGQAEVSTVFLGIDHAYGCRQPVLWETMVFGGPMNQHTDRCGGNREQAEAMHAEMVTRVKASTGQVGAGR